MMINHEQTQEERLSYLSWLISNNYAGRDERDEYRELKKKLNIK